MTVSTMAIPRIAPKAYEYVKHVLDFTFRNAHSPGFYSRLESGFAEKFGQKYGVLHHNGTATMQSALLAAEVGVGDEVIVPSYTVISTAVVAFHVNAIPVIADVDPETWTISVEDIRRKITPRTRAIIPVSICGLSPDYDPIMKLAKEHNITVIEDNAQCVLGYYKQRVVGSIGHLASFSFQASKHVSSGAGGITLCSDDDLALRLRRVATLGFSTLSSRPGDAVVSEEDRCQPSFPRHTSLGYNMRLPEIAAAVAFAELERVEEVVEMRTLCGQLWLEILNDCDWLVPQKTPQECVHSYWTAAARIMREDIDWAEFRRKFVELGGDGFYGAWLPLQREPAFANLYKQVQANPQRYPHWAGKMPDYRQVSCPVWEKIQPRIIQLKTNYWDSADIQRQVDIFAETLKYFK